MASIMQHAACLKLNPRLFSATCARSTAIPSEGEVESTMFDAFSNPKIVKDAQARWGLGATPSSYASIVFPKGRPEISETTKKMIHARIARGYAGQRLSKEDQRSCQDVSAQTLTESLGRGKVSAAVSPNPHLHKLPKETRNGEPIPLWQKHKMAIKEKMLGKTWNPQRKLSRQSMDEVRYLRKQVLFYAHKRHDSHDRTPHQKQMCADLLLSPFSPIWKQFPEEWTASKLADHFNVASESIVRILKTDFQPSPERAEEQDLARHRARKANVSADLERRKAERHALWLEKKAERERIAKQMPSRIKLGAPKRSS